jgi:tRNA pseudouridine38-40 synthase
MRTLKLLVAYDGTSFVGWQRQAEGISVQGLLEQAFGILEGAPVPVVGAGRTDAGVHATGQVASLQLQSALPAADLLRALNAHLPDDVRVLAVEDAADGFHARFQARSKTYEYRIMNGPLVSPFARRYVWHVPVALDPGRMQEAARLIEGRHDFACFQSTGGSARTSVRRVFRSDISTGDGAAPPAAATAIVPEPAVPGGRLIVYRVTGDGFLRHMVRAIVGTLVEIGRGAADAELMRTLLAAGTRAGAGPTAPASGLCLTTVSYNEPAAEVATQR